MVLGALASRKGLGVLKVSLLRVWNWGLRVSDLGFQAESFQFGK